MLPWPDNFSHIENILKRLFPIILIFNEKYSELLDKIIQE